MIDFGLIALFSLELVIVGVSALVLYHAYNRITAKILELKPIEGGIVDVTAKIEALAGRVANVENTPLAFQKRMAAAEEDQALVHRGLTALENKVASVSARASAMARPLKRQMEIEMDGATEVEGDEVERLPPPRSQPRTSTPPGFGMLKRKAG